MSKQHESVNKWRKALVFNINVLSKMSKLSHICCFLLIFHHSGWISSSFVAADKHIYGPSDFKGLIFHVYMLVLFLSVLS